MSIHTYRLGVCVACANKQMDRRREHFGRKTTCDCESMSAHRRRVQCGERELPEHSCSLLGRSAPVHFFATRVNTVRSCRWSVLESSHCDSLVVDHVDIDLAHWAAGLGWKEGISSRRYAGPSLPRCLVLFQNISFGAALGRVSTALIRRQRFGFAPSRRGSLGDCKLSTSAAF
jgi:hypothetical protein